MHADLADFLRTAASFAALALSALSVWFTRRLWVQSNRPVVTAAVRTYSGENNSIAFDLAVINSGTRPAVTVRLSALHQHLEQAMEPTALVDPRLEVLVVEAHRCFSLDAVIPLLLNGQTVTNAFGHTGNTDGGGSLWKVGATIPVDIAYSDLEGRLFRSHVVLVVQDSAGFAGSSWSGPK